LTKKIPNTKEIINNTKNNRNKNFAISTETIAILEKPRTAAIRARTRKLRDNLNIIAFKLINKNSTNLSAGHTGWGSSQGGARLVARYCIPRRDKNLNSI